MNAYFQFKLNSRKTGGSTHCIGYSSTFSTSMKKTLAAALLAFCASAQTPTDPPALIRIIRSDSGLMNDAQPMRPYANTSVTVFGMRSISGLAETWLIETHDTFGSVEDLDRVLASARPTDRTNAPTYDVPAPSRSMIALYRPGFSYRPEQAIRMFPTTHYFHVSIYRTRPGNESEFAEMLKLRRLSADSVNLDRPDIAYQVISGAPSGMYIVFAPLASLRTLDNGAARVPVYAEGTVDAGKKIAAGAEISREHLLFRIDPRISRVSEDFASADPEFWLSKRKPQ